MTLRWPPAPLGIGTQLNLAVLSRSTRSTARRRLWWILPIGFGLPLLVLGLDQILFAGSSLERVRELGSEPLPWRLLIVAYSGITEELIYRLGVATLVAWLILVAFARRLEHGKRISEWLGNLVAAVLFGLAHVGNLPDLAHPVLRAVTVNGILGLALGWLYWCFGLELAIVTHMAAIVCVYIVLPAFLM